MLENLPFLKVGKKQGNLSAAQFKCLELVCTFGAMCPDFVYGNVKKLGQEMKTCWICKRTWLYRNDACDMDDLSLFCCKNGSNCIDRGCRFGLRWARKGGKGHAEGPDSGSPYAAFLQGKRTVEARPVLPRQASPGPLPLLERPIFHLNCLNFCPVTSPTLCKRNQNARFCLFSQSGTMIAAPSTLGFFISVLLFH